MQERPAIIHLVHALVNGDVGRELYETMVVHHKTVTVQLQDYLVTDDGGLDGARFAPAKAEFQVNAMTNATVTRDDKLVTANGVLVNVQFEQPEFADGPATELSADRLNYAYADILFDIEDGVGVVVDAASYGNREIRLITDLPKFAMMDGDGKLKGVDELLLLGYPKALVESPRVLRELRSRQALKK